MPISLHPTWHPMLAHFAVGFTMGTSILVVIGFIARLLGFKEFPKKLTYPLHVLALLSLISLVIVSASTLMDFPAASFAASPWFKLKTSFAILTFFVYTGVYTMVMLRRDRIWENPMNLAFMVALAVVGGFTVSVLGAAGGYLEYGHSILEPVLRALGFPMPRT